MSQQLYKPAEACKIAEVAPYVLRYWETEFPVLSQGKEKVGPRSYTERDVRIIARIRELLYDEGFTVAGAKKRLEAEIAQGRFEDGLEAAPTPEQQRTRETGAARTAPSPQAAPAAAPIAVVSEAPEPGAFLTEAASSHTSAPIRPNDSHSADFPERKRVIRELKEVVRILDRARAK